MSAVDRLFVAIRRAAAATPPGASRSLEQQAKELPAKALRLAEAHLDELPTEVQRKTAETEALYAARDKDRAETEESKARTEKTRAETKQIRVETETSEVNLVERKLDLLERLRRVTDGKPLPQIVDSSGREVIVVADLLRLPDALSANPGAKPDEDDPNSRDTGTPVEDSAA